MNSARIFHFRCSKIIFKYKIFKPIFHLAEWYQNTKCINFILVDAKCVSECWVSCSIWLSVSYTVKLQLVIRFWHCRNSVLILTTVLYAQVHFVWACDAWCSEQNIIFEWTEVGVWHSKNFIFWVLIIQKSMLYLSF